MSERKRVRLMTNQLMLANNYINEVIQQLKPLSLPDELAYLEDISTQLDGVKVQLKDVYRQRSKVFRKAFNSNPTDF